MGNNPIWQRFALVALAMLNLLLSPSLLSAHPMGNFSISHYAGIRIERDFVEIRYLIDMAEIPTFQEMQQAGIAAQPGDPRVLAYLANRAEILKDGLFLTVNGHVLPLEVISREILFSPGAGNLPTVKLGVVYHSRLPDPCGSSKCELFYRDSNFPGRAGWQEVVANPGRGISVESSTVPAHDRSAQLSNYPADLINSAPQDLQANIVFCMAASSHEASARLAESKKRTLPRPAFPSENSGHRTTSQAGLRPSKPATGVAQLELRPNQQSTPRNAFTDLIATKQIGLSFALLAALIAAGLGALHALEPGHGKTIVAAYLVGSSGTALHALLLGMVVTISHTAGVYVLGLVTLYAQKYIMPDRVYPFLGVLSGLLIAGMGFYLFLQRYVGGNLALSHGPVGHRHFWDSSAENTESRSTLTRQLGVSSATPASVRKISARQLLVLGITGGIVPCPAALVVLLSAVALHRVSFGLFLIAAFSAGLAAVLVVMGLVAVYARRLLSRARVEGPLLQRWLPLSSAAMITLLGCLIAVRGVIAAGIVQIRM